MIGVELIKKDKSKKSMDIEKMVWLAQNEEKRRVLILMYSGHITDKVYASTHNNEETLDKTFELFADT